MNQTFQVVASRAVPGTRLSAVADRSSIQSHDLLQGRRELVIRHGDREYRLRHTQNDKLILTR